MSPRDLKSLPGLGIEVAGRGSAVALRAECYGAASYSTRESAWRHSPASSCASFSVLPLVKSGE